MKMAKRVGTCIEFPGFGARYPDAACIDGYLWDLDSGDEEGLTHGGNDPCPTCNTKAYIQNFIDNDTGMGRIYAHMKFIFTKYG